MDFKDSEIKVRKPVCTVIILIFTISAYFFTRNVGKDFYNMGTVMGDAIFEKKELYRLLTGMFLHANAGHIIANMLLLFCLGEILEEEFGTLRLAVLYFVPGIVGNFASAYYYFGKQAVVTSVGASAGIYGLLGAVIIFCIRNHGDFHNVTIPKLFLFFMISILEGILAMNIDLIAHVAGLVTGLMFGILMANSHLGKRFV